MKIIQLMFFFIFLFIACAKPKEVTQPVGQFSNDNTLPKSPSAKQPELILKGDKGDKGDKGEIGATGPIGPQGPAGPPGNIRLAMPFMGDEPPCPEGTYARGGAYPKGYELWCETETGLKHGYRKIWYYMDQATKKIEENYYQGLLDDTQITYYRNGKMKASIHYEKGELHKGSFHFYENGRLQSFYQYELGKKEGLSKELYDNGIEKSVGNYVNDKKYGRWIIKDRNGKILADVCYEHDLEVEHCP